jgi:sugar lactone lactonase YvrE
MVMQVRRVVALASSITLALYGCTALPVGSVAGRTGLGQAAPALQTALVRLSAASQLPLKQGFATKGISFSDPSVAYLRFTAAGTNFAPVTADFPWTPGTPLPAIAAAVPVGTNRIFTLSAMDAYKHVLVSLKGVASVAASGANNVTIDWATTPTATVLENLAITDPALVSQVDVAQLQTLVNTITGYDAGSGSFTQTPARVDARAIASQVATNAGTVPADDPSFFAVSLGSVDVQVQDADNNPVASGVRLQINDLTSAPVAATTLATTTVANVALGRWQVTATHATAGTGTSTFELHAGATPTVTVTLGAPATIPSGNAGTVTTLYSGDHNETTNGSATTAVFYRPAGVVVVGNKAYVTEHSSVRVVDLTTGAVSAFVGNGVYGDVDGTGSAARFKKLGGIVANHAGTHLYVADADASKIKRITIATGQVVSVAGNGQNGYVNATGSAAAFFGVTGVAISPNDDYLIVSDVWNHALRKVTLPTGAVTDLLTGPAIADGPPGTAKTDTPTAVAIDPAGQYAYFCDNTQRIRRLLLDPNLGTVGTVSSLTTGGSGAYAEGAAAVATFAWDDSNSHMNWGRQSGLAVSADNTTLYVSDTRNQRIRKVDLTTGTTSLLAGNGQATLVEDTGAAASMAHPAGLSLDANGNMVFVDAANRRLRRLNTTTGTTSFLAGSGSTASAEGVLGAGGYFADGSGLAYDTQRNRLYLVDRITNRIMAYDPLSRELHVLAGSGERGSTDGPAGSASFDFYNASNGMVYDPVHDCLYVSGMDVRKITLAGTPTVSTIVTGQSMGLALDATAAYLYAGTYGAVRQIDLNTNLVVPLGSGTLTGMINGLAVKGNDLYAAAGYGSGRLWRIDLTNGAVTVAAGTGTAGNQDGTGTTAQIGFIAGMALDAAQQHIYLGDYWYFGTIYAIRRYRLADGQVSSLMRNPWSTTDGPLASAATAGGARSVAFDTLGTTLYFLDVGTSSLRKVVFQ